MSATRKPAEFDPYVILHALEAARVDYILVGAFARVLQGSDESTKEVDFTPRPRSDNIERLTKALDRIGAEEAPLQEGSKGNPRTFYAPAGRIVWLHEPAGTRGYTDLRRRARRLHLGEGLYPQVAAPGDLVRLLEAADQPEQARELEAMRRLVELERGIGLER